MNGKGMGWPTGVRRRGRLLAGLAVLPLGMAGLAAQALVSVPAAQASITTTFTYTGLEQMYPVPPGVTAVTVTAVGAPGGTGISSAAGGVGAVVTATVPLPADTTTLYVEVAGTGSSIPIPCEPAPSAFNGGGSTAGCGGGGGGASDVRTTSIATVPDSQLTTANDSRLVVAGGGGGSAFTACVGPPGGTAGDSTVTGPGNGGAGSDACTATPTGEPGGNGGFGGGAGGGGATDSCSGDPGSLGQGGNGPPCPTGTFDFADDGGGGGGGYYGGGAGGNGINSGGGGGAGSSFWVTGATNTSMSENTTGLAPEVQITPVIDNDLSIAVPGNITAEATSAAGAAVSFTVTVTDPDDASPPAATCVIPSGAAVASGSVFPIGTTKATCTASDADDSNSPVSASFTVTVVVPALRFGAHAYGQRASFGRHVYGPTARANLTCTTTAGSVTGRAYRTATTASGARTPGNAQQATATATVRAWYYWVIHARSITATATAATPAGGATVTAAATVTFSRLRVGFKRMPAHPAPDTIVRLFGGTVLLNQQIPITDAAGQVVGITVNAIAATFGSQHLIIGHASAALTFPGTTCPAR